MKRESIRHTVVGGLMLLLAGCGEPPPPAPPLPAAPPPPSVSMAPPGQDAVGKQFNPPPPGLAAVYFFNPTTFGPAIAVGVGPMVIGSLAPLSWMRVELSPGWHAIRCMAIGSVNPTSIMLAPGDTRFVAIELPPGAPLCTIQETAWTIGRAGVLAGNRAMQ